MAKRPTTQNPGERAERSGQVRPVKGGDERTVVKGKRIPPTPEGGPVEYVDLTKNKSGTGRSSKRR
jgi:hypothetical protein